MEFSMNEDFSPMELESKDALIETIKMIEDDYFKFNEIVDKKLQIENDLEKELEKEDRKCTFLRHTVAGLKKKLEITERLSSEQRKYILDLQMEIEQISSSIYEEMEGKRIAYPEEDAKSYQEMVNVVKRMVDCITNFKTVIQQNIDDCMARGIEITYWKNTSEQLMKCISELKISKDKLTSEVDQLASYINGRSLENINQSTRKLQEIHKELRNTTIAHQEVVNEKNKRNLWKQQIIAELVDKKTSWLSTQEMYERSKKSSAHELNILHTEVSSIKQKYNDMMNEMKTFLDIIEKGLNECECLIQEKSAVLEDMNRKEITDECKDETIILSIQKINDELSQLRESNKILQEQELFAKDMYISIQLHTNALKTSISENEIYVKNLQEELTKLENHPNSSVMDREKSDYRSEFSAQTDLENMKEQNDELDEKRKILKQEATDLLNAENELKVRLDACGVEIDFLNLLHDKISIKINEEKRKANEEMNDKIEKCIENVTEMSNVVLEKDLLLDSVKAELQKCFNSIPELESEIKILTKENSDKKIKLFQTKEKFNNEERNLQSKIKLLEDLEKNTFPKTRIPKEFIQPLQQQKSEYEKAKAERIELEEKLNNLKKTAKDPAEKKNDSSYPEKYSDTESKQKSSDLEKKSQAYKMFKERIMKKSGSSIFG